MRKFLSVAILTALLTAQQGSAVEALAQSFRGALPAEGGSVLALPPSAAAPLSGTGSPSVFPRLAPALLPSLSGSPAAPSAFVAGAAAAPAPKALGSAAPALAAAAPAALSAAPAAPSVGSESPGTTRTDEPASAPKTALPGALLAARPAPGDPKDAAPEAALAKIFDGARVNAYLVRAGHEPVLTSLAELPAALASGDFAQAFNKNGHFRLILGEGGAKDEKALSGADLDALKRALGSAGLRVDDKRARTESIPIASRPAAADSAQPAPPEARRTGLPRPLTLARVAAAAAVAGVALARFGTGDILGALMLAGLIANVDGLVREFGYAAGMLKVAFKESKRPRWNEVLGGIVGKIVPAVINIGIFAAMYKSHPLALVLAAGLSLAVETFHGVFVNAWDTFQSKMGRQRGMLYQNIFNFAYGTMISGSFRAITYFSVGGVAPPWSLAYWKDMSLMTIIGTFCGTLGYRGLNSIYEKGRVPRWGRATIQQLRDFCMMMIGPFFGTGNMFMTWLLFGVMQSVDLAIFFIDSRLQTRPIVYLADDQVVGSDAFRAIYVEKPSPLKQALDGVKGFILIRPFVALYRKLAKRRSGK